MITTRHVIQDLMHKLFSVVVFKDTLNLKTLIVLQPYSGFTYSGKTQQSLPLLLISLLLLQGLNFLQEAKLRTNVTDLRVPRVLLLKDKFNTHVALVCHRFTVLCRPCLHIKYMIVLQNNILLTTS